MKMDGKVDDNDTCDFHVLPCKQWRSATRQDFYLAG